MSNSSGKIISKGTIKMSGYPYVQVNQIAEATRIVINPKYPKVLRIGLVLIGSTIFLLPGVYFLWIFSSDLWTAEGFTSSIQREITESNYLLIPGLLVVLGLITGQIFIGIKFVDRSRSKEIIEINKYELVIYRRSLFRKKISRCFLSDIVFAVPTEGYKISSFPLKDEDFDFEGFSGRNAMASFVAGNNKIFVLSKTIGFTFVENLDDDTTKEIIELIESKRNQK